MNQETIKMSVKKSLCVILLPASILLLLPVHLAYRNHVQLDTLAPRSELVITPSKDQVAAFEVLNREFQSPYDADACYNVTPDFVAAHSDYTIFKYEKSHKTFLLYDGQVYGLGEDWAMSDISSVALADLNKDGKYELYFTFLWGSGLPRSQVGYFNPANKKVTVFDQPVYISDLMLTMTEGGVLCVNSVTSDYYDKTSYVDYVVRAKELVGTITLEMNHITARFDQTILEQKPDLIRSMENMDTGQKILYQIKRFLYKLGINIYE